METIAAAVKLDLVLPVPCGCGCGLPAPLAPKTDSSKGWVRGEPLRFIKGHNARLQHRHDLTRFWGSVDSTSTPTGCHEWTGYRNTDGYGQIMINGRTRQATHIVLELAGFMIPAKGLQALHRCDNPPCCRLDHLEIGPPKKNSDDMVAKGRQARGERHGSAKLNPAKVVEIRALYQRGVRGRGYRPLAKKFGVDPGNIRSIVRGETSARS